MARRKKTSPTEDVMELVSMLPWWVGVGLAIISYLLLHAAASQKVDAAVQAGQMGTMVTQTIWKTFATVGQFALPIICLAGAAMSAWKRKHRTSLITNITHSPASNALDGMSWQEFELLVGEGFRMQGYKVIELGGGGADGGIDLVLSRPGRNGTEEFLVQCKQWRAFKVGVDVVRELYGVMAAKGAAGGFVVTSGTFTSEAIGFASGRNVTLLDGHKLDELIRQAKATARGATSRAAQDQPSASVAGSMAGQACPSCSRLMVRRTAKRGSNAGGEFWGCTGYPVCRGTRPVA